MLRQIILMALLMLAVASVPAKPVEAKQVYIFGFSASFKDSTVYITDIQELKGAWIDHKTKFLLGRENYSLQLGEYFSQRKQHDRVCMVFYATDQKKANRLMARLKKKSVGKSRATYDVRYLKEADFRFTAVNMSPDKE